jgi:hypothetical protein
LNLYLLSQFSTKSTVNLNEYLSFISSPNNVDTNYSEVNESENDVNVVSGRAVCDYVSEELFLKIIKHRKFVKYTSRKKHRKNAFILHEKMEYSFISISNK